MQRASGPMDGGKVNRMQCSRSLWVWACRGGCRFIVLFSKGQHLAPISIPSSCLCILVKCLSITTWRRHLSSLRTGERPPCNYPAQLEDKVRTNRSRGRSAPPSARTQMWRHTWFSKQQAARRADCREWKKFTFFF